MISNLLKSYHTFVFLTLRHFASKGSKKRKVPQKVLMKLDCGYQKLVNSKSKSLLKKHLKPDIFKKLRKKAGPNSTLLDCIQSGLAHHDSGCGIYAPEAAAYKVFAKIFNPIIEDYHAGFDECSEHPKSDFGDPCTFENIDPKKKYIVSTRIRCARSVKGYPFNPTMKEKHYLEIEEMLKCVLGNLDGELKGKFFPLCGMDKKVQKKLIDDHYLFKEGDRFLQAANSNRFWPKGRGIFLNDKKTFLVWCNEEDHIRIISMQPGGHFGEVYGRLVDAVKKIGKEVPFAHDERLGFLTFCPTNLGTTIRASVHIKVPKLAADPKKLEKVASKYKLQVRGTRGEHSAAEGGIYDISNKRRLGLTEFQAVKEIYNGITELIKLEQS